MTKPTLYTASTLRHAPMWRALRSQWTEIEFTATWIDTYLTWEGPDIATICEAAWTQVESDVFNSHYILAYADANDALRGGLIESGMGIAFGHKVLCVGAHSSYGTWQYHPAVLRVSTLEDARRVISNAKSSNR